MGSIDLKLARDEQMLINNALDEVCNGIDFSDDEFHTRLGTTRLEAQDFLKKVASLFVK